MHAGNMKVRLFPLFLFLLFQMISAFADGRFPMSDILLSDIAHIDLLIHQVDLGIDHIRLFLQDAFDRRTASSTVHPFDCQIHFLWRLDALQLIPGLSQRLHERFERQIAIRGHRHLFTDQIHLRILDALLLFQDPFHCTGTGGTVHAFHTKCFDHNILLTVPAYGSAVRSLPASVHNHPDSRCSL